MPLLPDPLVDIDPGYYAVAHPDDPDSVTCWVRTDHPNGRSTLAAWPPGAEYVPRPATEADRASYRAMVQRLARHAVNEISADPGGCARRFSQVTLRCHDCGRKLTDPVSRRRGIGPDCLAARKGPH